MAITISISPAVLPVSLSFNQTATFTATVTGDPTNAGVTWSLQSEAILDYFGNNSALIPNGRTGTGNGLTGLFTPISSLAELIGTLTPSGLTATYKAPSMLRTTPVRVVAAATSLADGVTQGTAQVLLLNASFVVSIGAGKKDDQWDICVRCGMPYPMAELTQQKGNLYCTQYCWDNLQPERRPREIQMVLESGGMSPTPEASDRRVIDRGFFVIDVETG